MIPKIQEEMANIETHVGRGAGKEQFLESYLDLMRQVNALNQKFLPRIDNPIKNPIKNPIRPFLPKIEDKVREKCLQAH